jgi:hypothetical protein
MCPRRILGLAITVSALAISAALAATGTPGHVPGTLASVTAAPAVGDMYRDKPLSARVATDGTYLKSGGSNLNEIGQVSFTGIMRKDVGRRRVAQRTPPSNEAPARIANIWGGFDHQPTESQVQRAEQAAGVAPDVKQQRRESQILRQLDQELLNSAAAATG